MQLHSLRQLTFSVEHTEACLHYYTELLGMESVCRAGVYTLSFPGGAFTLYPQGAPHPAPAAFSAAGSQNLCLRAQGDPEEILSRLVRLGADVVEPVVRERTGARGPIQSIYTFDPDHNLVELGVYVPAPGPFALTGLDHMVLIAGDLETTMAFYLEVLGLEGALLDGQGLLRLGDQKCNVHHRVPKYTPHIPYAAVGSLCYELTVQGDAAPLRAALAEAGALAPGPEDGSLRFRDPDGNLGRLCFLAEGPSE